MAVVRQATAVHWRNPPKNASGIRAEVRELAKLTQSLEIHWMPSHGKKRGKWTPPEGISEQYARWINEQADEVTGEHTERAVGSVEHVRVEHERVSRWAEGVNRELARRYCCSQLLLVHVVPLDLLMVIVV